MFYEITENKIRQNVCFHLDFQCGFMNGRHSLFSATSHKLENGMICNVHCKRFEYACIIFFFKKISNFGQKKIIALKFKASGIISCIFSPPIENRQWALNITT